MVDKRKEYRDKYRSTEKGKQKAKAHYKSWITPEKRRMYAIKYREKSSRYSYDWYQRQDKAHINQIHKNANAKRRALKRGSFIEHVDMVVILELDDGICQLCKQSVDEMDETTYTIDHGIPISKGGEHSYINCQLAHRSCNSRKHNKLIEDTY